MLSVQKNPESMPKEDILKQLEEKRALPMGRVAFHDWADRIISGALIPGGDPSAPDVFNDSQKFCLANMLMHLGPTVTHCEDSYFINSLRKFAINQVADTIRQEISAAAKARLAAEEAAKQVDETDQARV